MKGFGGGGRAGGGGRVFTYQTRTTHRALRLPARSLPYSGEFAALGLTPFASLTDVKSAYKRLALKCHPDVIRGGNVREKELAFREIKSAYEILMVKFEEERTLTVTDHYDDEWEEWDEWDEWMGYEGGIPVIYDPS